MLTIYIYETADRRGHSGKHIYILTKKERKNNNNKEMKRKTDNRQTERVNPIKEKTRKGKFYDLKKSWNIHNK